MNTPIVNKPQSKIDPPMADPQERRKSVNHSIPTVYGYAWVISQGPITGNLSRSGRVFPSDLFLQSQS